MASIWSGVLIGFVIVTSCFILQFWWSRRRMRELAKKIPGPDTLPLLGNLHQLCGTPQQSFTFLRKIFQEIPGKVVRIWEGPLLFCFVPTPEDVESLLITNRVLNRDPLMMKVLSRFLGNGLIVSRSEAWKKQRKTVTPAFHNKILEGYMDIFNTVAQNLVDQLKPMADGRIFEVYGFIGLSTLDSICRSILEVSIFDDDEMKDVSYVIRSFHKLMSYGTIRMTKPWLILDTIYNLTKSGKEQLQFENMWNNFSDKVILKKREEYRILKQTTEKTNESETKKKTSFMDYLIRSVEEDSEMTYKQVKDEMNTIVLTGQETSATTMCFTLMFLGIYSDLQEEIVQELKEVFADDWKRPITPQDIKRMGRLDRFIKEVLRIVPMVMIMTRQIEQETQLSSCTLPAGANALVWIYNLHRDPRYFPDPERFDPDRFLPERSQGRHPYAYIPFGAGPRSCIGFKYAEWQMATILATLLKYYRVLPVETQESIFEQLEAGLVAKPKAGFRIKLVPR